MGKIWPKVVYWTVYELKSYCLASLVYICFRYIAEFTGEESPECAPGGVYHCKKKTFRTAVMKADTAYLLQLRVRCFFHINNKDVHDWVNWDICVSIYM